MKLQANGDAPYTTTSALVTAIEAYRDRGLGIPMTPEVLTRAGVPESIARRTLHSMKTLGLIADTGHPLSQFEDLRVALGNDEYQARFQEWIRAVYADVLQYADPTTHSLDRVAEAFRGYKPAGQRRAMASLLIGLWRYSGLPVASSESGTRQSKAAAPRTVRRPVRAGAPSRSTRIQSSTGAPDLPPGLMGLLHEIPVGSESWTSERRDAWLGAFKTVLDFTVKVDDHPARSLSDNEDYAHEADREQRT